MELASLVFFYISGRKFLSAPKKTNKKNTLKKISNILGNGTF